MDLAGIASIVALILALVVPLIMLLRTQRTASEKEAGKQAEEQGRLDAAATKKQAKLERGAGKKKKGALSRMKKGSNLADDATDDVPESHGQAAYDDSDDDEGPATRKDQRKADKKADHRAQVAERNEQREAIRE